MRNIKVIRNLPISQLTDEEILKATIEHLDCKAAVLIYYDRNNGVAWLAKWKNKFPEGKKFLIWLKKSISIKIKMYQHGVIQHR